MSLASSEHLARGESKNFGGAVIVLRLLSADLKGGEEIEKYPLDKRASTLVAKPPTLVAKQHGAPGED